MRATRWVLLLAVVALCTLPTVQAFASDARLEALTVQREFMEDYDNFRTYPTVAARYQNLVTSTLGHRSDANDYSVGVIGAGDNTNYGVFALYLNNVQGEDGDEQAQLDLTWAKAFEKTTVGASVLYTKSSVEAGSAKETPIDSDQGGSLNNPDANFLGVTAGVKIDMNDQSMLELAAGLGWFSWEEKNAAGVVTSEDDGNLSYRFAGRIFSEMSDRTTLVPLIQYRKMDLGSKTDTTVATRQRTMLDLGVALQYEVNGNDLLILGVSASQSKDEVGTFIDETSWHLPSIFAALEFDVYSWLTVRTGATKTWQRDSDDAATPAVDVLSSSYSFGLGMGLHFDHFDVDATVNPDAVFTGGYLFSGETSAPLNRVTATYYF